MKHSCRERTSEGPSVEPEDLQWAPDPTLSVKSPTAVSDQDKFPGSVAQLRLRCCFLWLIQMSVSLAAAKIKINNVTTSPDLLKCQQDTIIYYAALMSRWRLHMQKTKEKHSLHAIRIAFWSYTLWSSSETSWFTKTLKMISTFESTVGGSPGDVFRTFHFGFVWTAPVSVRSNTTQTLWAHAVPKKWEYF